MKLVWFRNDLRVRDNHALYQACQDAQQWQPVVAVAVLTPAQWKIQDEGRCRVQFWLANLRKLAKDLAALNIPLKVLRVASNREVPEQLMALVRSLNAQALYFNREYPEYEQRRDDAVSALLGDAGITVHSFNSDTIIEPGQVRNKQGLPFRVFTPFSKAWRSLYAQELPTPLPMPAAQMESSVNGDPIPSLSYELGSNDWDESLWPAGSDIAHDRLQQFAAEKAVQYPDHRDYPAMASTSTLSPYLSVGALSARQCMTALQLADDRPGWMEGEWLQNQWALEIIWREFYRHLLVDFPEINRLQAFKPDIERRLVWSDDDALFNAWSCGETGFPLVDAGMKQLLATGWMHNRVRMLTASFLTKILRQDWRKGAEFFMQHLIDGDFASNQGGWQWSASVGADAAPYFRIFSPQRQAERFDPDGLYIARWLPELEKVQGKHRFDPRFAVEAGRPQPIIDYSAARNRSIDDYNSAA